MFDFSCEEAFPPIMSWEEEKQIRTWVFVDDLLFEQPAKKDKPHDPKESDDFICDPAEESLGEDTDSDESLLLTLTERLLKTNGKRRLRGKKQCGRRKKMVGRFLRRKQQAMERAAAITEDDRNTISESVDINNNNDSDMESPDEKNGLSDEDDSKKTAWNRNNTGVFFDCRGDDLSFPPILTREEERIMKDWEITELAEASDRLWSEESPMHEADFLELREAEELAIQASLESHEHYEEDPRYCCDCTADSLGGDEASSIGDRTEDLALRVTDLLNRIHAPRLPRSSKERSSSRRKRRLRALETQERTEEPGEDITDLGVDLEKIIEAL